MYNKFLIVLLILVAIVCSVSASAAKTSKELNSKILLCTHLLRGEENFELYVVRSYFDSLAKPYKPTDNLPGYPSSVFWRKRSGRYILTKEINPLILPYKSEIGARWSTRWRDFDSTNNIPRAKVIEVTDIILTSESSSGSQGSLVRVGFLDDYTPVVLKKYVKPGGVDRLLDEARSAEVISALAIGPRFHGVFLDSENELNVVMDIVPGDHSNLEAPEQKLTTPITLQTFADLEVILSRLMAAGAKTLQEFQLYRTHQGRLMAIDPNKLWRQMYIPSTLVGLELGDYVVSQRSDLLRYSSQEIGEKYLDLLLEADPAAWEELKNHLKSRDYNPDYARYFKYFSRK